MLREKETLRLPKELVANYHVQPKVVTEKIRKEIQKIKLEKSTKLKIPELEKEIQKVERKTSESPKKAGSQPKLRKSVGNRRLEKGGNSQVFTLFALESSTYKDIQAIKDDNFNPKTLLVNDEDDPECREILKKFGTKPKEANEALSNLKAM